MQLNRFKIDMRDISFNLFESLKIENLFQHPRFADFDRQTIESILKEAEKLSIQKLAPANVIGDQIGAQFKNGKVTLPEATREAYQAYCENGFTGAAASPEWGGMGLPKTVSIAMDEMFISANVSLNTKPSLSRASADVILQWGTERQKKLYVEKLYAGQWQGTMCLTEAEAGSDVGNSQTAVQKKGDHYFLKGSKVFITAGDHNLTENHIHLVLGRIEGASTGTRGLSLFIVPKIRVLDNGTLGVSNDVRCGGIEKKMGIHGSPTTTLIFGDQEQCEAELLGKEGEGMKVMFQMMNEERIMVGSQGISLASAAYFMAMQYAKERIQGSDIQQGKRTLGEKVAIIEHPDIKRLLMHIKAFVDAGRALLSYTGYQIDRLHTIQDASEKDKINNRIALFTPICKAWCTDIGFEACVMAMQVFGGYGYIADYNIEQYVRDCRIASVYEGTNGIQAIDLLFRKVPMKEGQALKEYFTEIQQFIQKHQSHPRLGKNIQYFAEAVKNVQTVSYSLLQVIQSGELRKAALSASNYLRLLGNLIGAHLLLEQAVLASEQLTSLPENPAERERFLLENEEKCFYFNKIQVTEFYLHQILSENLWRAHQILSKEESALSMIF